MSYPVCHGLRRPDLFGAPRISAWEEHKRTGKTHGDWWSFKMGRFVLCDGKHGVYPK